MEFIFFVVFALIILFIFIFLNLPWKTYLIARSCNYPVQLMELLGMKIRKVDAQAVIKAAVLLKQAGINIDLPNLEGHWLAGGNVEKVASAMVKAKEVGIDYNFNRFTAIDLAGRDVLQCVKDCMEPIDFNSDYVVFQSKDGINYSVSINITIQKDICRIIGGKDEQTLINDIFSYIGEKINNCDSSNKSSIEPYTLEKEIMKKNFGSAFAIKSLKINIK